jgi:hypothetical protein
MSVTYTAALPLRDHTADFVTGLLAAEQRRRGTRTGTRALTCRDQAILVLRWLCDGTRMQQLARDHHVSTSTAYTRLHEGLDVLAARAPSLHGALLAAKTAGYSHVMVDGTLIRTDRLLVPGPTPGVHLWWSGKHHHHGGNIQAVTAPDGWPLWVSPVLPGRTYDITAARTHPGLLDTLRDADTDLRCLGDMGYDGEPQVITTPYRKPKHQDLTTEQAQFNRAHNGIRALAERGYALLKGTYRALRHVSLSPSSITTIAAAALVILHHDHDRTT